MAKAEIIPSQLQICVERITKEIASEYLKTSEGNRSFSVKDRNRLQREFTSDNWIPDSGQGIIFDTNGNLSDGHTRLKSFYNSDLEYIDITVVRGANVKAKLIYDTGKKRTNNATLGIYNVKNTDRISAILTLYASYLDGNITSTNVFANLVRSGNSTLSNATILELYYQEQITIDEYVSGLSKYKQTQAQLKAITPRIITFVGYVLFKNSKNRSKVVEFLDLINIGIGADEKIANYRNRIMNIDKNYKLNDWQKIDMVLRILYYFIGKPVSLTIPKKDSLLLDINELKTIIL